MTKHMNSEIARLNSKLAMAREALEEIEDYDAHYSISSFREIAAKALTLITPGAEKSEPEEGSHTASDRPVKP